MGAQLRPVEFSLAHSGGLAGKRRQNEWAGPAVTEVKSLPGWGVCLDWRREAAGKAHVERGSGATCGDPRRPTGFVDCRPRCRILGEGSPQTELCEGAAVDGREAALGKAEGGKKAAQAVRLRGRFDLGCLWTISAESEG